MEKEQRKRRNIKQRVTLTSNILTSEVQEEEEEERRNHRPGSLHRIKTGSRFLRQNLSRCLLFSHLSTGLNSKLSFLTRSLTSPPRPPPPPNRWARSSIPDDSWQQSGEHGQRMEATVRADPKPCFMKSAWEERLESGKQISYRSDCTVYIINTGTHWSSNDNAGGWWSEKMSSFWCGFRGETSRGPRGTQRRRRGIGLCFALLAWGESVRGGERFCPKQTPTRGVDSKSRATGQNPLLYPPLKSSTFCCSWRTSSLAFLFVCWLKHGLMICLPSDLRWVGMMEAGLVGREDRLGNITW